VVEVGGHTDNVGGLDFNQSLSIARAKVVREALVSGGVAPAQLQARGYGYARPVADNGTAEGRQANRRTELVVLSN
jgi:outer membrane protein OmpA-like peptidoglycan-associated protein